MGFGCSFEDLLLKPEAQCVHWHWNTVRTENWLNSPVWCPLKYLFLLKIGPWLAYDWHDYPHNQPGSWWICWILPNLNISYLRTNAKWYVTIQNVHYIFGAANIAMLGRVLLLYSMCLAKKRLLEQMVHIGIAMSQACGNALSSSCILNVCLLS